MKKKREHVIPNCYLKAWCDPRTPAGQLPYIGLISEDGAQRRNRSPEKSFVATDRYTIKLPSGRRNLLIEDTLAGIENMFVQILKREKAHNAETALHPKKPLDSSTTSSRA